MNFDLSHLTQPNRFVFGPVQDEEALLLYALVRCLGARRVLEVGGLDGYSARNFLAAGAEVWTVDINPVPVQSPKHTVIRSNIDSVGLRSLPVFDLVFYDAHALEQQYAFHRMAQEVGVISDETTVVVHDTGLHKQNHSGWAPPCRGKFAHQHAERLFVERLAAEGWQRVHVHDDEADEPRHGLTILQLPRRLA